MVAARGRRVANVARVTEPNVSGGTFRPQQPPQPLVLSSGSGARVVGIILGSLCGVPGLLMLVTGIIGLFGDSDGHTGVIIASAVGAVLLVPGLYGVYRAATWESSRFVIDESGMRVEGTRQNDWRLAWFELAGVWIPTATKAHMGAFGGTGLRSTLVRLEFVPIDQRRFAADHPRLRRYYGRQNSYGAYRIPLGPGARAVQLFDDTLRMFAPGRYRGVIDEGIAWGFRYT